MITELQQRELVAEHHDPSAIALFYSSITTGLAAHHLANPEIKLKPALDLAQAWSAASLP